MKIKKKIFAEFSAQKYPNTFVLQKILSLPFPLQKEVQVVGGQKVSPGWWSDLSLSLF